MKRREHALLIAMTIVTVLILAGCGDDRNAASPSSPGGDPTSHQPRFLASPSPVPVALAVPAPVTKLIKAKDGGELAIGNIKIAIPKYALPVDAVLTLTLTSTERVAFRVDPVGLPLALPAEIVVEHLRGKTDEGRPGALRAFRMVPGAPEPLPTSRDDDKVTALSTTLGEFAFGRDRDSGEPIQFLHYLSGPGFTTKLIEASAGGIVQYGRCKVQIPKNALSADTYITVRDPGTGYLMCELEPHGIHFLIPVQFEMDLKGLHWQPYTDWTDYWFNEETGLWERQTGTFDGDKIVDSLSHFSRYVAGRAGW